MLKENCFIGMEVKTREYTALYITKQNIKALKRNDLKNDKLYVIRFLTEVEKRNVKHFDPSEFCIVGRDPERGTNYQHIGLIEPYDLVVKKNKKGRKFNYDTMG